MRSLGRHNPRLSELRRRVKERRPGEVVVDGLRILLDVARWELPIRELYLAESTAADPSASALADAAEAAFLVEDSLLWGIAPTHHPQGVLGIVGEPRLSPWPATSGIALYLDTVQDPGNVGAIARVGAALGGAALLLSPGCADPFHWAAVRGSAGAVLRLPVERSCDLEALAGRVRQAGGEVWATGSGGVPAEGWRPKEPTLLLLGAEGRGLDRAAAALADGTVWITLGPDVESLNVAVAAGILLDSLRRTRRAE